MSNRWLLALLAVFLTGLAMGQTAEEYRCLQGDLQRRVAILYETGVAVPCEVHYYKETEAPGERLVLWRALNESGYCEARVREFVEKLTSWGWSCSAADGPASDDTDALAPATELETAEEEEPGGTES